MTYIPKYRYKTFEQLLGKPDSRDKLLPKTKPVALPSIVDLTPDFPIAFNQGELGSCDAFAAKVAYMYYRKQAGLAPLEPSALFDYYVARMLEGTVDEDSGASIRDSLHCLYKYGTIPEPEWVYDIKKFTVRPSDSLFQQALANRIPGYKAVTGGNAAIQAVIASSHAPVIGIPVYTSFESDKVAKTGIIPMPKARETLLGYHEIVLGGYANAKKAFRFQNSWGPDWGVAGRGWISYAYIEKYGQDPRIIQSQ